MKRISTSGSRSIGGRREIRNGLKRIQMYQWVRAPQICPNFFSVPLKMKDALVSKEQEFPIKLRKKIKISKRT